MVSNPVPPKGVMAIQGVRKLVMQEHGDALPHTPCTPFGGNGGKGYG